MSEETRQYLNGGNILIGNTDLRGKAWWYLQAMEDPENPTHYPNFIPVSDVQSRLFNWTAETHTPMIHRASTYPDAKTYPNIHREIKLNDYLVIVRSDTGDILGIHSSSYEPHQLADTLIAETANILGGTDQLGITSAGLLKNGAVAWIEVSIPETLHDNQANFPYRPNLLGSTSFNGTLPSSWTRTTIATVCDNTLQWALQAAGNTGKYKVRHTKHSIAKIRDAKSAIGIIEQVKDDMDIALETLVNTKVSGIQFNQWLDLMVPIPEIKEEKNNRGVTVAIAKRDKMVDMWTSDKRVAPWRNTALGVMQVINTYSHHENTVAASKFDGNKLQARVERNQLNVLKGTQEEIDRVAMNNLFKILETV